MINSINRIVTIFIEHFEHISRTGMYVAAAYLMLEVARVFAIYLGSV